MTASEKERDRESEMGAIGCTQHGEREKEIISEIFNIYSEREREKYSVRAT